MRKGFTLIELLVVIAIIGILASIVMVSLNSARTSARDTSRIAQIREVKTAIDMFFLDHGRYPQGSNGCTTLPDLTELEPYINISSIKDPVYESTGNNFRYARVDNGNGYAIRITFEDTNQPGTDSDGQCITGNNFGANPCNWGLGSNICGEI